MRRISFALSLLALIGSAIGGCGSSDSETYDPAWGVDDAVEKSDGILEIAPRIAFDETVTGNVGGDQVDIWVANIGDLRNFKLEMEVTSGDLNPHVTVLHLGRSYLSSQNWDRTGAVLTKDYETEYDGLHMIVARAYKGEGSGDFSLKLTCNDADCGLRPAPATDLDLGEVDECLISAQACALNRLPRYNGAVGPARARTLLEECLAEDASCANACEWEDIRDPADENSEYLCGIITEMLQFYADQTSECVATYDNCFDDCEYGDNGWADEVFSTTISICNENGFNGNCDSYARSHETCGGEVRADSATECFEHCYATSGAWVDDLDVICDESCEGTCGETYFACGKIAGLDDDAFDTCLERDEVCKDEFEWDTCDSVESRCEGHCDGSSSSSCMTDCVDELDARC